MSQRYDNRIIFKNDNAAYESLLDGRNKKAIVHYGTPTLYYPSQTTLRNLTKVRHVWTIGDRYYKLAAQYYGSTQYWWVIGLFNQMPTEADVLLGQVILIPTPLQAVLRAYEGG